jgi:hypothetical protein
MTQTILGLPLAHELETEGDYAVSPYSVVAVVRGFDSDGEEVHAVVVSEGMSAIEASGLLHFATVAMDEQLKVISGAKPEKPKPEKK